LDYWIARQQIIFGLDVAARLKNLVQNIQTLSDWADTALDQVAREHGLPVSAIGPESLAFRFCRFCFSFLRISIKRLKKVAASLASRAIGAPPGRGSNRISANGKDE